MSAKVFRGGVPTAPDVEKLLTVFRRLRVGDVVTHETMVDATEISPRSCRYRTVVAKARKVFSSETGGVVLAAVIGEGLVYPTGGAQLRHGAAEVRRGSRKIRRGCEVATGVADDRLDAPGRASRDYMVAKMVALSDAVKAESRKICMSVVPTATLPK
jgi:hypothetical protein